MNTKGQVQRVEIHFEVKGESANEIPKIVVSGISAEALRQPEKIRQLMELLELPEGTNARILLTIGDVIVR